MRRILALVCVVLTAASIGHAAQAAPARATTARETGIELAIVDRMNAIRAAKGLRPLAMAPGLRAAAALHSRTMAEVGFFEHESNDGTPFWKRVSRLYGSNGFDSWSVGENILWSSARIDADTAVRNWMRSLPHRRNILSPVFREVGVGVVWASSAPGTFGGHEALLATCDFGARA
jgi:uncharacterized protein YkwD